ncbi:isochorismatase family domain-containing protein [Ditylenchus destructor]|uniref:Isochorismatase domain-containing protein 1 n=1 Tax=Ditylenchus destructor TaxID=166010 RepID=A0AAD4MYL6_9BILA|nr:isochorismatase family domain-containing protein [Ditylenchus destructor]
MLARYGYLNPLKTVLLVCDMQSKNREAVDHFTQVAQNVRKLMDSVRLLGVKIIATEHQSDSANAHSAEELNLYERDVPIIEKTKFTMFVPEVQKAVGNEIKTIVLCGIESHVCVYQTAVDFLTNGYNVHVVVDASSSRSLTDRTYAYKQLASYGANLTTAECIIYALMRDSNHPKFEDVKQIFLEDPPDTGLVSRSKCSEQTDH